MGSIDKYCPHCASTKITEVQERKQMFDINIGLYYVDTDVYYECEDCNETWEPHE